MSKKMTQADKASMNYQQMRIVIVGHVDHGKSSLIGRLLFDTESLPPNKQKEIHAMSERRGMDMEWSFVLDSFQAERDQAITIDTTQIWFKTENRNYVIIDAPGHREFLKNMISGAAAAEAAILVVDANEGVKEQTKRHAYLLHLLGLRQIIVAMNKMDLVNHDQKRFDKVSQEVKDYLTSIGLEAKSIIPISARNGDNIARGSDHMGWYNGPNIVERLDAFTPVAQLTEQSLRFPIQDVYRYDQKRILAGRIESGSLTVGDDILFSPTGETAKITGIETWPKTKDKQLKAHAGDVVGITLDQPIFVERGHVGSTHDSPPMLSNVFRINLFWLSPKPLKIGNTYKIRVSTHEVLATVQAIDKVVDTNDLKLSEDTEVKKNGVAEVVFRSRDVLALDPHDRNVRMGRCMISDGFDVAGGGIINMDGYPDQRLSYIKRPNNIYTVEHLIPHNERALRNGHKGSIFWFTGLSGAGKSTLAMNVERALYNKGYNTYVLDGDNVRHGLNKDLGFSPEHRTENIRRIAEVASLMADAGLVTITSFISPYREDRHRAREVSPEHFHEIFVKADLATCEQRDPKSLYKKAREGKIKEFTGISSPYEEPENPDLIVDTQANDLDVCVQQVLNYIESHIRLKDAQGNASEIQRIA